MAQEIKVSITLEDGKQIQYFSHFKITQKISEHSYFEISFPMEVLEKSDSFILNEAKKYIGTIVSINMKGKQSESEANNFKGLITEVKLSNEHGSFGDLIFSGYSPTILLEGGNNLKSFSETNIKKIVEEITKIIPSNVVSISNSPKSTTTIPYIVQYNESDFNFLNRIAVQFGEWFYYDGSTLIFGSPKDENPVSIEYLRDSDDIKLSMSVSSLKFSSYQYDYMKKEIISQASSNVPGLDPLGKHAFSQSEKLFPNEMLQQSIRPVTVKKDVEELVKAQLAETAASFVTLKAETDIPSLKLGSLVSITLKNQENKSSDAGSFRIIEIQHHSDGIGNYENSFVGIPEKLETPPAYNEDIIYPKSETQPAIVIDNKDPEGIGRVKVKMFWQTDKGTPWLRLVHPHAGKDKGFYFIPEIDEEVMVGFEHGNPDAPYVIGAMYNGKEKSTWKQDKNYLKAIKTISGNMIWFNDEGGKEEIKIVNKDAQNEISLTLQKDGLITIKAKDKIIFDAPKIEMKCKEMKIDSENKIEVTTKETKVTSQQKFELKTMSSKIEASTDFAVKGAQIKIEADATCEIKGSVSTKVEGAILELKGSGMAKLQGGMVMIN